VAAHAHGKQGHPQRRPGRRPLDAPGRYADAIAVPGDPLTDLELLADVPFVMQGGRILKDDRSPVTQGGRLLGGPGAPLSAGGPYFPA
jgi:hypothetical protein